MIHADADRSRHRTALVLAAVLAFLLAACGGGSDAGSDADAENSDAESSDGARGGTLTLAASSAPISFNPGEAANGGAQTFFQILAYEPLIDKDADGNLVPGLATDWGFTEGQEGLEFWLELREGALFADGTPVDAEAVAASLNWFVNNATGSSSGSYIGWEASVDGERVLITTPEPTPVVDELLTPYNLGGNIISPAGLEDPSALENATFGAGPYVYVPDDSVAGDHYTYVPNENYYDQDRIHFDEVVVRVVANPQSALQAARSGQIDVFAGDSTLAAAAEDGGLATYNQPQSFLGMFVLDWEGDLEPALGEQLVRQAMSHAIDREAIATAVLGEFGAATAQPNTPGWDAYDEALDDAYPYDPEIARSLLAEAGYADGFSFQLLYTAFESTTTKVVQAMAQQLAEVGIEVELVAANSFPELVDGLQALEYEAVSLMWGGQTQFANTNQLWNPGSPLNYHENTVEGLPEAFDTYIRSTAETRTETAQAVQQVIVDQALSVTAVRMDALWFANADLEGFALTPTGNINNPADWTK